MSHLVTSFDVASLAGVSQSAVSRSFTPGASISSQTREKVMQAANKLGYQPNAHARSLITGRSRIIGLVVSYLDNLFYPAVLEQLSKRLQLDGFHVLLFVNDHVNSDDMVREILQYKVDGIVLGATTLSSRLAKQCSDAQIPVVLFNRIMAKTHASMGSVRSDNRQGGYEIAKHFLNLKRKKIAYIAGRIDSSTNLDREQGFITGLAENGHQIFATATGNYSYEEAIKATYALFNKKRDRPDAVFVASDQMALAVMDTLRHHLKLKVPQDVCVAGFDNVPQASWPAYQLTTYAQPISAMVEATVQLLQNQLLGSATLQDRNVLIPGHLIIRQSSDMRAQLQLHSPTITTCYNPTQH
jgi:DNA-binding LacI/PurR family transcriptional regulator